MHLERLVDDYNDAWNRRDVAGMLKLFHKDASYYDAFWMESCRGPDLAQYLHHCIDEEKDCFQRAGDVLPVDDGVVYRYNTHEWPDPDVGRFLYSGAEVLILRGDKIFSVTDYYCDPRKAVLEEVARWAARRHGKPRNMRYGLAAVKASKFRARLAAMIDKDQVFLDPNLTLSQAAESIGCSAKHLIEITSTEFGSSFYSLLDQHRARFARELLQKKSDDPNYVYRVAERAGFRSLENFDRSFTRVFGMTATEFYRSNLK